ncbi:adenylyl-sulfate kinase [Planctomycetota bacterium]|nr:adenylyl-sulfate kinase [Planctomycetota bacterium]
MELLRFAALGSVDDGKSTLIGRLLTATGNVPTDQLEAARKATRNPLVLAAGQDLDLALLTDGLHAEREQGITIDVAYRHFTTTQRRFIIADAPGHPRYTRNMATAASTADLALLVVDAQQGLTAQTKRHAFVASLLGVRHLVVCVNKLDALDYAEAPFRAVRDAFSEFAARLNPLDVRFLPVSALVGDNVVEASENLPWYAGPTLLHLLDTIHIASDRNLIDLRLPVQMVVRDAAGGRAICGTVASGVLRPGERVCVLPSGETTRVARLLAPEGDLERAVADQAVAITLEDPLDVGRGDLLVHPNNRPRPRRRLEAMLVWLSETPLVAGSAYDMLHGSRTVRATVAEVRYAIDVETLRRGAGGGLELNGIGRVVIDAHSPVWLDPYQTNRTTGGFVLIHPDTCGTVAAGMLVDRMPAAPSAESEAQGGRVSREEREQRLGQRALTVWLTGLSGAGKTTLADALERRLFQAGRAVARIDGDVLRGGLSKGLGFSDADRAENVRRAAEAAQLLNHAGQIAIVSLISPLAAQRAAAREVIGGDRFLLVHVATNVDTCRERDPKGLYARSAAGELPGLTGVDAPYDEPESPWLRVDTTESVEACVQAILERLTPEL